MGLVLLLSGPPGHKSVGRGVDLVTVFWVGPRGTGVVVDWLDGGCLGGLLLGHDVDGAEHLRCVHLDLRVPWGLWADLLFLQTVSWSLLRATFSVSGKRWGLCL